MSFQRRSISLLSFIVFLFANISFKSLFYSLMHCALSVSLYLGVNNLTTDHSSIRNVVQNSALVTLCSVQLLRTWIPSSKEQIVTLEKNVIKRSDIVTLVTPRYKPGHKSARKSFAVPVTLINSQNNQPTPPPPPLSPRSFVLGGTGRTTTSQTSTPKHVPLKQCA